MGNHAPNAVDDKLTEQLGRPLTISAAQVLANDTDADGDPLAIVGAYLVSGTVKSMSYDAKTGDVSLASVTKGDVAIEYLVSDGRADPVATTMTVTFAPGAASDGRDPNGASPGPQPSGGSGSPTSAPPSTAPTTASSALGRGKG